MHESTMVDRKESPMVTWSEELLGLKGQSERGKHAKASEEIYNLSIVLFMGQLCETNISGIM